MINNPRTFLNKQRKLLNERIKNIKTKLRKRKQDKQSKKIDSFTHTIDNDQLFDLIDYKLSCMDLNTLYQIRVKLKSDNDDTELIDKAIAIRKKRDLTKRKIFRKKEDRLTFGQIIFGIFLGSSGNKKNKKIDYLMPWEIEKVNKGIYESFNFEEEEFEDDDYYNDDLD